MAKNTHTQFTKMLLAIFFSVVIFGIFSLIYTLIIYFSNFSFNRWITLGIGAFAFLILGFLSGNFQQRKGLFWGFGTALLLIFIILIFKGFRLNTPYQIIKYLIYLLMSASGGLLGLNFKCILK